MGAKGKGAAPGRWIDLYRLHKKVRCIIQSAKLSTLRNKPYQFYQLGGNMTSFCGQFVDKLQIEKIIIKSLDYYFDGPSGMRESIKMATVDILEHQGR